MGLFERLKKKTPPPPPPKPVQDDDDVSVYSHMRVEVTTKEGQLLFVAKLMYPQRHTAELHQYSESDILLKDCSEGEALPVHIRGYHDRLRKAVYMEGFISPMPKHIWLVSHLYVARVGNDRAFFRLETNLPASVTKFSGRSAGEYPCRLLNISVGGARIGSEARYHEGDKFLLKVRLLEDRPESAMFSQVMRVTEKENARFEYGCRFLELTEEDQERITQNIFAAQRQKRGHTS